MKHEKQTRVKRPPRRRVFTVTVGRNGLGYTTLLVTTEDGRMLANSHQSPGWSQPSHVVDRIRAILRADLEQTPPLDRRGRPNRDDLAPIHVVHERDLGDEQEVR